MMVLDFGLPTGRDNHHRDQNDESNLTVASERLAFSRGTSSYMAWCLQPCSNSWQAAKELVSRDGVARFAGMRVAGEEKMRKMTVRSSSPQYICFKKIYVLKLLEINK